MTLPPRIDWPEAGIRTGADIPSSLRVTRDNWRLYPWSRWAFQHTRELVPSRALTPAASPRPLNFAIADLSDLHFADDDGTPISWATFEDRSFADGVIILHRGAVIHERYLNGMTDQTPHHAFSVTKSFVGLLAELLIADGTIDQDRAASDYVPELSASAFAPVSVRHLMDMTDGVAFDEDYANGDADVHRYSASYWTPAKAIGGARETLTTLTTRCHLPGSAFSYRTPVADALAWVLVRASGQRLSDLFSARLWHPAGCSDPGHFLLDTAGDEIAASGLNTTLRDLARLALLIMEDDALPPGVRASVTGGGDQALFARSAHAARSAGSYRSQWWVSHDAADGIAALGVFGQRLHIDLATGLALVRFGSHPLASNVATDGLHRRAIAALRTRLA